MPGFAFFCDTIERAARIVTGVTQVYTWGYAGWGNAAQHFVEAADAHEGQRGFAPPIFIDLRIHRNVRAANFQGNNFRQIVGASRYVWMDDLGNHRIESRRGAWIQIKNPDAAIELLRHVRDYARERRRVVLFCSCRLPLQVDSHSFCCHRVEVARLLSVAARQTGLALEIAEWPGGTPRAVQMPADARQARSLARGLRYIDLGAAGVGLPPHVALPWGSTLNFVGSSRQWTIVTGPAYVTRGRWVLKSLEEQTWRRHDLRAVGFM